MNVRFVPFAVCLAAYAAVPSVDHPEVTFYRDVLPILQTHCQQCHRPGNIGPFSMLNYPQVRPWAKAIKASVATRQMPPWFAAAGTGPFKNDPSLSPAQIATLVKWTDTGAKPGDPRQAPAPLVWTEKWSIGKPDLVLKMKQPIRIPARTEMAYQYILLPTSLEEDRWIEKVELRPSNRAVVHHAIIFARAKGSPWLHEARPYVPFQYPLGQETVELATGAGNEMLAPYTPGTPPSECPTGTAKLLKAGSDLVLQVHYTARDTDAFDQSEVALVFSKHPPARRIITVEWGNTNFRIPARAADYPVTTPALPFPQGAIITGFFPHMHLRGKSMSYYAVYPDGRSEKIFAVDKFNFSWQLIYQLSKPLVLPPGSMVKARATYDNSVNNPLNPNPNVDVPFGYQSWDEMLTAYFDVEVPPETSLADMLNPRLTLYDRFVRKMLAVMRRL